MLILECSQGCYGRTDGRSDGSITISLRNFVGEDRLVVFSGIIVSSNNKTDHHEIAEILLKVVLNTINLI
jgi:hypothetical protein